MSKKKKSAKQVNAESKRAQAKGVGPVRTRAQWNNAERHIGNS